MLLITEGGNGKRARENQESSAFLINNINTKLVNVDWLREMQFSENTIQKKGNSVQITNGF